MNKEEFLNNYKELDFRKLFKENKEKILSDYISQSKLNSFINSKSSFILRYLFNIRYTNYKMLAGKICENLILNKISENEIDEELFSKIDSMTILDEKENLKEELKDLSEFIKNNLNKIKEILKNKILLFENQEFVYQIDKYKIKIIPDFVFKNKETNKVELFENKYTKRMPNIENISFSHIRQVLFYNTILKETSGIDLENYILYSTPKKMQVVKINTIVDKDYLKYSCDVFYKFIKDLNYKTALYYISNDLDSFYINDIEKEIAKIILKKDNINLLNISVEQVI
jgi:hypothetical protein